MFLNIEVERLRNQMSKADMANKLDVTPDTVNDWICRKRPIPADKLRTLSQIMGGISVDYLLKRKETVS